jgi:hypothetical protein
MLKVDQLIHFVRRYYITENSTLLPTVKNSKKSFSSETKEIKRT